MALKDSTIFGFIKPSLDAHTLGIYAAAELLRSCGYPVIIGDPAVSQAVNDIRYKSNQELLVRWLREHRITYLGLSYRLDPDVAVSICGHVLYALKEHQLLSYQGGPVEGVSFAGLPQTAKKIMEDSGGFVLTFQGSESPQETLVKYQVPAARIPRELAEGSRYDEFLLAFGKEVETQRAYLDLKPVRRRHYPEYGTSRDTVEKRLQATMEANFPPLMRAHVGPYSSHVSREENVKEFVGWTRHLAATGYLDILSIGSSQLTQSRFDEEWGDAPNGGGVPLNSAAEFRLIRETASPMLCRTYAGTTNIPQLAQIYEENLNIAWHALSLWWFNKMDGRGPYDVYTNLQQHEHTLAYIARTGKPFEPNVPHHFAFRGADDTTYVLSGYLAARLAKKKGVRSFIAQVMLNTPRYTWGIQDLAKARALLQLIRTLEDESFKVYLQPRAGLDYFSPDLQQARIQLAAVSALMDDIEPRNEQSPPLVHVVSYSEADHLATPPVINESIQITHYAIQEYRRLKRAGRVDDMTHHPEVQTRTQELTDNVQTLLAAIETHIPDPYSAEGLYQIFAAGFLPTPYLWAEQEEFRHAAHWQTKPVHGSVKAADEAGRLVSAQEIAAYAVRQLPEIRLQLKQRQSNVVF